MQTHLTHPTKQPATEHLGPSESIEDAHEAARAGQSFVGLDLHGGSLPLESSFFCVFFDGKYLVLYMIYLFS